jgi:hypothetical protein
MVNSFQNFINFRVCLQFVNICAPFRHLFLAFLPRTFLIIFYNKKISQANA